MADNDVRALVEIRLEQAQNCLQSAEALIKFDLYKDAANRSYYCVFHSMRSVLALDKFDSKKHSGIISAFRQRYIKTGKFAADFSNTIEEAFDIRADSDYQDFYTISKDDVQQQVENAKEFLEAVQNYIDATLEGQE